MCTFKGDRSVMVCDSIRDTMKRELTAVFGTEVSFTHVDFQGTLVEASSKVNPQHFRERVQQIIAAGPA